MLLDGLLRRSAPELQSRCNGIAYECTERSDVVPNSYASAVLLRMFSAVSREFFKCSELDTHQGYCQLRRYQLQSFDERRSKVGSPQRKSDQVDRCQSRYRSLKRGKFASILCIEMSSSFQRPRNTSQLRLETSDVQHVGARQQRPLLS